MHHCKILECGFLMALSSMFPLNYPLCRVFRLLHIAYCCLNARSCSAGPVTIKMTSLYSLLRTEKLRAYTPCIASKVKFILAFSLAPKAVVVVCGC